MATWCVYHLIHVTTPHRHLPKLVITQVPEDEEVTFDLVERAGYLFGEFGIPRANHYLTRVDETTPSDLVARIRRGEGERLSFTELTARARAEI